VLLELRLAGLGVIDDVTLELPPGLSVLTGETGAGKTMRVAELSRMLSGMPTDEAAAHGEQLLAKAAREKG
jgi:DNA repair ATPase RecN